jgi:hypothetical protein
VRAKKYFFTQLDPNSQILLSGSDMSHLEKLQPEKKYKKVKGFVENAMHINLEKEKKKILIDIDN